MTAGYILEHCFLFFFSSKDSLIWLEKQKEEKTESEKIIGENVPIFDSSKKKKKKKKYSDCLVAFQGVQQYACEIHTQSGTDDPKGLFV